VARFDYGLGNYEAALRAVERYAALDPVNLLGRVLLGLRDVSDLSASAGGTPLPRPVR